MEQMYTPLTMVAGPHCIPQETNILRGSSSLMEQICTPLVKRAERLCTRYARGLEIANALIEEGADVRAVDNNGQTTADSVMNRYDVVEPAALCVHSLSKMERNAACSFGIRTMVPRTKGAHEYPESHCDSDRAA
jgi:hypothetical protein